MVRSTHGKSRFGGVIDELVAGTWVDPGTNRRHGIPPDDIVIEETLDGREAELVRALHPEGSLVVVADENTWTALGRRVFEALRADGREVSAHVWTTPACSEASVHELGAATRGRDALIAVGSGTVNDSVKYAAFLDGRDYSVFATSPMTAYTSATASVSFDGFKRSIPCRGARGIFFDLSVVAHCPRRLISAAFADVVCRTTSQVDWWFSHRLLGTAYSETPYVLLAYDERDMIDAASRIAARDLEAIAMLVRVGAIMGLGTSFTATTHSGSMGEHMISHWIDMFAGDAHPGTSHGEQVGLATVTLSRLQNEILGSDLPPSLRATDVPTRRLIERYGDAAATGLLEQTRAKAFDADSAAAASRRLADDWPAFVAPIRAVMLPHDELLGAMRAAGCRTTPEELGIEPSLYAEAVRDARWIRDRFTLLDVADDAGLLAPFIERHVPESAWRAS